MRTYKRMLEYPTFEQRFSYLKLSGTVGEPTFGGRRTFNQDFYHSTEWRNLRAYVITRDNGCDLADPDHPISGHIYIHHIVPVTDEMLIHSDDLLLNPDNLVCCSHMTHEAIHYGDESLLSPSYSERKPGDTTLW